MSKEENKRKKYAVRLRLNRVVDVYAESDDEARRRALRFVDGAKAEIVKKTELQKVWVVVNIDDLDDGSDVTVAAYPTREKAIADTVDWVGNRADDRGWPLPKFWRDVVKMRLGADDRLLFRHTVEDRKGDAFDPDAEYTPVNGESMEWRIAETEMEVE